MSCDILIVDDERDIREMTSDILQDNGYVTRTASNSTEVFNVIKERVPNLIILDIWLQGSELDGLGILRNIKASYPNLPVVMMSGHGTVDTAVQAIKMGAYDFIEKPFDEDRLSLVVKRALDDTKLRRENEDLKQRGTYENQLIGTSSSMTNLRQSIEKIAQSSSRIMITGPAGSGKEVVARSLHEQSLRSDRPFIVLNTTSLHNSNSDQDLFGKEINDGIGSKRKIGILERAHSGTLYIDEIANIPMEIQGKLLRFLQKNTFERIGGNTPVKIDVRIIAATSRDLKQEIENGNLREELYYRLNVSPISVTPLNDRKEDLVPLIQYFMRRCAKLMGVAPRKVSQSAIAVMQAYHWPGNVRQLRNVIEWLLIMAPQNVDEPVTAKLLPPDILAETPAGMCNEQGDEILSMPLRGAREAFEKQYLKSQLNRFGGNVSKTAEFVGMERSAFHRKLRSLKV